MISGAAMKDLVELGSQGVFVQTWSAVLLLQVTCKYQQLMHFTL